ncbi:MAG: hypothetical protein DSZ27_08100 [Thiomicrospira sp.]|nr:MAG: hypothetical protein DSZ27_08100 [Thiomicrospira sp.]
MINALIVAFLSINITIGYVVASVLFSHLESAVAGKIMGHFFSGLYIIDVLILLAVILILFLRKQRGFYKQGWLWVSLLLILLNALYLSPIMAQLKLAGADAQALGMSFSGWHAASQIIFMLALGFVIIWWLFVYSKTYSASTD